VVLLAKLPLTANGKLDRQALPTPEAAAAQSRLYEPPQTEIEHTLAAIWEQVLRRERIGRLDNFFEIGGHSLLATQIISRVRRTFEVELPLHRIFETPTISELAAEIAALKTGWSSQIPPLIPVSRSQDLPLSFAQQRLWVVDQLDPYNPLYNINRAWRLTGHLNVEALQQSINAIVQRHESQRTTFKTRDGEPVQVVAPTLELPLAQTDLTFLPLEEGLQEARRIADSESTQPFNLECGPLVRASLCKLAAEDHVLILTMHHIVSDAWSAAVYFRELRHLYESLVAGSLPALPPLNIQYADYAVWQRRWMTGAVLEKELVFWRHELAGTPWLLALPTDRPRLADRTFAGTYETFRISAARLESWHQLSRETGVTPFMALLSVFGTLLARLAGAEQVVIGTDVANRIRVELEQLIGFFINLLPLKVDVTANPTFRELLDRVRTTTLGAYAHQELPFDKIVEDLRPERNSGYNPLVQVLFVMQNVPRTERQLVGLTVDPFEVTVARSKFDLAVFTSETDEGLVMHWLYSTELFSAQTIRRMARQFETLLANATAHPNTRVNSLGMHSQAEQAELEAERKQRKRAQLQKAIRSTGGE
jgi:acyl carrier protein